jgi:hypothetical protein
MSRDYYPQCQDLLTRAKRWRLSRRAAVKGVVAGGLAAGITGGLPGYPHPVSAPARLFARAALRQPAL